MKSEWYNINEIDAIDSPALVVYIDRVIHNIKESILMTGDAKRLRPHVKTHKTKEVVQLLLNEGVTRFKCATIAEAEMLALVGAPDVLLAYQPTVPKIKRLIKLMQKYEHVHFSCVVDNNQSVKNIAAEASVNRLEIPVYIDLNVGMNRTGIVPGNEVLELFRYCSVTPGVTPVGLHVYDGHIRQTDLAQRTIECDKVFEPVFNLQHALLNEGFKEVVIVAGGSPTFPIHAKNKNVECSPGTFVFWDRGYELAFPEQKFLPAALVVTRVISIPGRQKLCLDLGHKSIAAENILDKRVFFLNAPELKFISQSEEHLVVETETEHSYKVGDLLYGIPYHICPTISLYERALVIENHSLKEEWKIIARDRKITI
ncbi:MAG: D-TA family PLP-dependent enzyme [Chitinophagales bacterium]